MDVDPDEDPDFYVTFILCSFVFCERCRREATFQTTHAPHSDESYLDQASEMRRSGWAITDDDPLKVLCPACARDAKLR